MITISNIRNVKYEDYDEIWFIVQHIKSLPDKPNIKLVRELAPSKNLFFTYRNLVKQNLWNRDEFDKTYVPQFIKDIQHNAAAADKLNELYKLDKENKNICLVCFCDTENMCHRLIIADLLQGVGCDVKTENGTDYSHYFNLYKNN